MARHSMEQKDKNYFSSVQEQLSLTVGEPLCSIGQAYSANAEAGVSPSINAVDTGMKAVGTIANVLSLIYRLRNSL